MDVAVVGAGLAGLTAAHELRRAGLSVRVFEAAPQVGGRMASARHGGWTIDTGAEQISPSGYRATWELITRLGLTEDEVPRIGRPLAVWRDGQAHAGVAEARALLSGAGLSCRAHLDLIRFQAWAFRHRGDFDDDRPERSLLAAETVADFARRYHPDLHDYLFQPVAGSFFGWNTERSAAAVMVNLLLSVGSAGTWCTYRDGMDTPARRLAAELDVATGQPVHQVIAEDGGARLQTGEDVVTARSVLLCVPAPVAAELHANPPAEEAEFLAACTFTPALKVSCLLDAPLSVPGGDRPYVLLTPAVEEQVLSAIVLDHEKHPGRAPAGKGLLTLMANAATIPDLLSAPDAEIIDRLTSAVPRYLPGFDAVNRLNFVHRHRFGLPEATPAALHRRARFMARPVGPVDYAGDWVMLRPASEGAVRAGALAASRVLSRLRPLVRPVFSKRLPIRTEDLENSR
ncbi:oxygen-dependent protoporphyrinogen oxidase [Saccharopolyspora antimicrobica]|uniref:Oxygen-dependent protoporphyrinogen oxidase n=1 Tax=Saccharopolyspora antimicrobica TaxID=455193 RepID=A0A1I4S054_9PSEU|nr:NAD(P)/FAD-dependent oxidoreductase [Saccharopolyspora antimicrobica]RKT89217.1 oxygen-dependent protoporphyrinogen oxidase [Saccharopolyspora antimicrobica]SFM57811.1 oxygen-dependent protoporphyrinogen oxidase [Saccharopolyspora antimicrobica]